MRLLGGSSCLSHGAVTVTVTSVCLSALATLAAVPAPVLVLRGVFSASKGRPGVHRAVAGWSTEDCVLAVCGVNRKWGNTEGMSSVVRDH